LMHPSVLSLNSQYQRGASSRGTVCVTTMDGSRRPSCARGTAGARVLQDAMQDGLATPCTAGHRGSLLKPASACDSPPEPCEAAPPSTFAWGTARCAASAPSA
jgi:hypothetical protein